MCNQVGGLFESICCWFILGHFKSAGVAEDAPLGARLVQFMMIRYGAWYFLSGTKRVKHFSFQVVGHMGDSDHGYDAGELQIIMASGYWCSVPNGLQMCHFLVYNEW